MKNIILIGMRGSGKSQIGRVLANKLNRTFIDLDKTIEKEASQTITEIVAQKGWEYFRNLESETVKTYAAKESLVIASGGGIVLKEENISNLQQNGILVLLQAPTSVLAERIKHCPNRPSLTGQNIDQELEQIWQERQEKYIKAADIVFDVSQQSANFAADIESKAEQIIARLHENL